MQPTALRSQNGVRRCVIWSQYKSSCSMKASEVHKITKTKKEPPRFVWRWERYGNTAKPYQDWVVHLMGSTLCQSLKCPTHLNPFKGSAGWTDMQTTAEILCHQTLKMQLDLYSEFKLATVRSCQAFIRTRSHQVGSFSAHSDADPLDGWKRALHHATRYSGSLFSFLKKRDLQEASICIK